MSNPTDAELPYGRAGIVRNGRVIESNLRASSPVNLIGRDSLPCSLCELPVVFEFTVESSIWNRVVRSRDIPEYLCLWCFAILAEKSGEGRISVGVNVSAGNVWSQWCGDDVPGAYPDDVTKAQLEAENTALRKRVEELEKTKC